METLKDEADIPCANGGSPILIERRELGTVQPDATGGGLIEPRQEREQRGFARARGPNDRSRFARVNG